MTRASKHVRETEDEGVSKLFRKACEVMRAEEWFMLAVRIVGVVIFLYGVGYILDGSLFHLGFFNFQESSPAYYLIAGISYGIVGLYLMRGAPHIVRFAYPAEEDEEEDNLDEAEAEQKDA